jgi:hypothetical protein
VILTKEDIYLIMKAIGEETVVKPTDKFPYRVSREGRGYSSDPKIGALQAKLSIMLEMARE